MTDLLHSFVGSSFGGIPMAQYWADLYLWEQVLNEEGEVVAVIELGSWNGGLSLYLQTQCELRGLIFRCYDVMEPMHARVRRDFVKVDIFAERRWIVDYIARLRGPVILFCDNGNKPRELREFTSELPSGSIVAVHDWGTETLPVDVPDWLEEYVSDFCDEIGSITRLFTVKA